MEVPRLSDTEEIIFPEPIGRCEAYVTGDLMDVIEHLGLSGVKDAWAKTVRWPGHTEIWRKLIDLHLLDEEPVRLKGIDVSPRDLFLSLGEKTLQYGPEEGDAICQRVEVSGLKEGERRSLIYEFMDFHDFENDISAMARTTAFPLNGAAASNTRVLPTRSTHSSRQRSTSRITPSGTASSTASARTITPSFACRTSSCAISSSGG